MFRKPYLLLLVVAVMSLLAQPAMADILLFNNGSLNGTNDDTRNYAAVVGLHAVTDSFVISTTSNLTRVTFGDWTFWNAAQFGSTTGGDLQTIDFTIKDSTATIVKQGDDVPVTVTNETKNGFGMWVSDATFGLSVQLQPGTYYLTLTDAKDLSGSYTYWDMNSATNSTATYLTSGGSQAPIPAEFFEIYGNTPTAAPEPATMLLLGLGLVGLAGIRRKLKS